MGLSTILLVIASCLIGVLILLRGDLTNRLAHMHSINMDPLVRHIGPLIKKGDLLGAANYLLDHHNNDTVSHPSTKHFRLNRQVIPTHYSLLIHPRLSSGDFAGFVNVSIHVAKPRSIIWMHAGMDFVRVLNFTPDEGTEPLDDTCDYGFRVIREDDALGLSFRCVLRRGNYTANLAFGGRMINQPDEEPEMIYEESEASLMEDGSRLNLPAEGTDNLRGLIRKKYYDGDYVR